MDNPMKCKLFCFRKEIDYYKNNLEKIWSNLRVVLVRI